MRNFSTDALFLKNIATSMTLRALEINADIDNSVDVSYNRSHAENGDENNVDDVHLRFLLRSLI